jgi:hypothetical protein
MDSALGVFGVTHLATPAFTVDAWQIQTPTTGLGVFSSGYNCYFSGKCNFTSIVPTVTPTITPAPTSGNSGSGHEMLVIEVLIPIIVFFCAIGGFYGWRRLRRNEKKQELFIDTLLDIVIGSHQANAAAMQNLTAVIQTLAQQGRRIHNVQQINARAPVPAPAPAQSTAPPAVNSLARIRELLTCPICLDLFHNPVSVTSSSAQRNSSCCKYECLIPKYQQFGC